MDDKLQAYDLLEMLILNLPFSNSMTVTTWCHPLTGYMKSYFWCMPMERYLTLIDNTRTHIWWVSSQSIIDKAYHTTRSHDPMWYILYASCVDQLESILHSLYRSTLYLLMLYHNILRHIKNSPFDCMLQVLVNQCSTHETLWLRHRAISWILLLKTNSQDLDHPWLNT